MNRGRVSSGMCPCRAPDITVHVVPSKSCTRTYSHRVKNTATYVHTGGVSSTYSRIYTDGQGLCTWRGNGRQQRRPVHRAANRLGRNGETTSCSMGVNRLGQNSQNGVWRTAERRKRPSVRPATVETGSCSSGGVWRTAKQRKHPSVRPATVEIGSCSSGGVWRTTKWRKRTCVTVETCSC